MKLLIKLSLFALLVFFVQHELAPYLPDTRALEVQFLKNELNTFHTDVIYFGDSSVITTLNSDTDRRATSSLLQELLPGKRVTTMAYPAYHAEVYEKMVEFILRQPAKPKVVIIPINLRSFSPQWDLYPSYQFEKIKTQFRLADTPVAPFTIFLARVKYFEFAPISQEEYLNTPIHIVNEEPAAVQEFETILQSSATDSASMKKMLQYFYMVELDPQHRKLLALQSIAKQLRQQNIPAVFYVVPIDYQTGEQYLPGVFSTVIQRNSTRIRDTLTLEGATVLDLSHFLQTDSFGWQSDLYVNEHLNEKGRQTLADELRLRLVEFFPF